ncbi:UNVERIFIED_ORG: hypothetical protein ABIC54_002164 [Burkholderia sp. 1263]
MRRISTATRVIDKFGAGKDGFTDGDAVAGIASTDLEDVWFDSVQEEIANAVEVSGQTLDDADRFQLSKALKGRLLKTTVFTSNGTFTPLAATRTVRARLIGGGGGGPQTAATGAGQTCISAGGAAGSYSEAMWPITSIGASQAVTIGAGGTIAGIQAGATSFGSLLTGPGGFGGSVQFGTTTSFTIAAAGVAGAAGTVSGSPLYSVLMRGTFGAPGMSLNGALLSGSGAPGLFGQGAPGGSAGGPGAGGLSFGAGGAGPAAGQSQPIQAAGAGASGVCIVEEFA